MIQHFNGLIEFYNGSINSNLCAAIVLMQCIHFHSIDTLVLNLNHFRCIHFQLHYIKPNTTTMLAYRRTGQLYMYMYVCVWKTCTHYNLIRFERYLKMGKCSTLFMNNEFMPFIYYGILWFAFCPSCLSSFLWSTHLLYEYSLHCLLN